MLKLLLVLAVLFFVIFGFPGTETWNKMGRKKNYMAVVLVLALTGTILYLLKMLKFAVLAWVIVIGLLYFWFYINKRKQ